MSEPVAEMVDVAFALAGPAVPREHRRALADAVEAALPWLAATPGAGVHPIKVVGGDDTTALLSRRARLVLRAPRAQAPALAALAGQALDLGGHGLRVGEPTVRELLPYRTLYAGFVATGDEDEPAFLDAVDAELRGLGVSCGRICGRAHVLDDGMPRVAGYSLMLDALSVDDARRVLDRGLGAHRRLGCGLFVPHRCAAAVGT